MVPLRRAVLVTALFIMLGSAALVWYATFGPNGEEWDTWRLVGAFTSGSPGHAMFGASAQITLLALLALLIASGPLVVSDAPGSWTRVLAIIATSTAACGVSVIVLAGPEGSGVVRSLVPPVAFGLGALGALGVLLPRLPRTSKE